MARKSVDLPTPEGPTNQRRLLRDEHEVGDMSELAAVGQREIDVVERQRSASRRPSWYARRHCFRGARAAKASSNEVRRWIVALKVASPVYWLTKKFIAVLTLLKASAAWLKVPKSTFPTK